MNLLKNWGVTRNRGIAALEKRPSASWTAHPWSRGASTPQGKVRDAEAGRRKFLF